MIICPQAIVGGVMDYKTAKGWLRAEEREALAEASKAVKDNEAIINIGVEYGASMVCLATHYHGSLLIGIDLSFAPMELEVTNALVTKAIWLLGDSTDKVLQSRVKALVISNEADVALLFVDGNHSYDGALQDAMDYTPLVKVGGVAIFHDCYDWDHPEEVSKNDWVEGAGRAVVDWFNMSNGDWEDMGKAGTMRIFRRRK